MLSAIGRYGCGVISAAGQRWPPQLKLGEGECVSSISMGRYRIAIDFDNWRNQKRACAYLSNQSISFFQTNYDFLFVIDEASDLIQRGTSVECG